MDFIRRGDGRRQMGLWCAAMLLTVAPKCIGSTGTLTGTSVSADLWTYAGGAVITQWSSPHTVVDPGIEFTGGQITPNAGDQPLSIQILNSIAVDADVFGDTIRIVMTKVPGSFDGYHNNFGPAARVNFTDLHFPGQYITGVTQIGGPDASSFVTGWSSVAMEFQDFSERTMDFQLLTTTPEPTAAGLCGIGMMTALLRRTRLR
jgi:hypothetical protein